jgi:integrase
MERITICGGTVADSGCSAICLRLEDGPQVFYHSTGIAAVRNNDGLSLKLNPETRGELNRHGLAMCKAYTLMQLRGLAMDNRVFETEVLRMLTHEDAPPCANTETTEPLYPRFVRYLEDAHRDGVIGDARYAVAIGKARKLQRFLTIAGLSSITADDFTSDLVLEFRQFVIDEYQYVPLYPELYPRHPGHRPPTKRCCNSTVVHDLKLLQAFFTELENTGEIHHSPFRKISVKKRRAIMHVMYDDPVFLRADEFRQVMQTKVPPELQWAKDLFVLNCAIGCRIGDLLRLTIDKVAVSDDGIPYIHYIPSKTVGRQTTNKEVVTPLIEPAVEIIRRTQLKLIKGKPHYGRQRYNKTLRKLLQYCGINRRVSLFSPDACDNICKPLYEVATSKLARKTHIDMLNKVQINYYAAGLHRTGSDAVFRYTSLELADRNVLMKAAFERGGDGEVT